MSLMKFSKKKVGDIKEYKNIGDIFRNLMNLGFAIKLLVVFFALGIILAFGGFAYNYLGKIVKTISVGAVKIISSQVGEEMEKDELGQVNVMIIGYGGENHAGGHLADTTMLASFNPKLGAVTFLSIPRDLYVKYDNGSYGRFNAVFAYEYQRTKSLDMAAKAHAKKITEITDIPVDYYALIDFKGFIELVDSMGGVDIVVPKDFVDYQYPDWNNGYQTFKISKGPQHIDGETALKYARSRHSTSDFSRALRQQQIIKAILNKILSPENITNIGNLKRLYAEYNKMVYTNVSFKNMLGMVKYMDNLKYFFSYVYSADCNFTHHSVMSNGCMLQYGDRSAFGGASVLLPWGATPSDIEHYKEMKNFAFYAVYNQKYQIENPTIKIINGIDKNLIKKARNYRKKDIGDLAIQLKNYIFNIQELENSKQSYPKTILYKNGTGDYSSTIETLKTFVNIDAVLSGTSTYETDMTLIMGNDYIN